MKEPHPEEPQRGVSKDEADRQHRYSDASNALMSFSISSCEV
jgi:hypothetical protein